jgi:hypothetical protein
MEGPAAFSRAAERWSEYSCDAVALPLTASSKAFLLVCFFARARSLIRGQSQDRRGKTNDRLSLLVVGLPQDQSTKRDRPTTKRATRASVGASAGALSPTPAQTLPRGAHLRCLAFSGLPAALASLASVIRPARASVSDPRPNQSDARRLRGVRHGSAARRASRHTR